MSSPRPPEPLLPTTTATTTTTTTSPYSVSVGFVDLTHRGDSHCSIGNDAAAATRDPIAELPSPSPSPSPCSPSSLADSFNIAHTVQAAIVDEPSSAARLSRRPSRRLPSFITRLSAAGGAASSTDASASRSFWQKPVEGAHKLHRRADERPRESPDSRGAASPRGQQPQTPCNPNSVAQSHSPSTPPSSTTTPSPSRRSVDASSDPKDGKRRLPATTASPSRSDKPVDGCVDGKYKMHQTSSRLLRMTDDDRPFTRVSFFCFIFFFFFGLLPFAVIP